MSLFQVVWAIRGLPRVLGAALGLIAIVSGVGVSLGFASDACETVCVEQAWARATPPGAQNAAIYFSIVNNDHADDTVASVSTPAAAQAMIHRTTIINGVARMEMLQNLRVPAHSRVVLAPTSYHIMLTDLRSPLKQGMSLPVTVNLGSGRMLQVVVPVLGVAALGPASSTSPVPVESGRAHH